MLLRLHKPLQERLTTRSSSGTYTFNHQKLDSKSRVREQYRGLQMIYLPTFPRLEVRFTLAMTADWPDLEEASR